MSINAGTLYYLLTIDRSQVSTLKQQVDQIGNELQQGLSQVRGEPIRQALEQAAQGARRTRGELSPLQQATLEYRSRLNQLKAEIEEGTLSKQQFTEQARILRTEIRQQIDGIQGWTREKSQLINVLGTTTRSINSAEGQMSKLGIAAQVNIGLTNTLRGALLQMGPAGNAAALGIAALNNQGSRFQQIVSIGMIGAIVGIIGFMVRAANTAANWADEIDKGAQKARLSVQTYQELAFAGDQIGFSLDNVGRQMEYLVRSIGNAERGADRQVNLFRELGVSLRDANDELRNAEDIYFDTIRGLQGITNETERSITAQKLFGTSAKSLEPILQAQAGSLDAMRQKARDMGIILSEEGVRSLVDYKDELSAVQQQFQAITREVAVGFLPFLRQDLIPFLRDVGLPAFRGLIDLIGNLTGMFRGLSPEVASATAQIVLGTNAAAAATKAMTGLFTLLGVASGPAGWIALTITALGGLALALNNLTRPAADAQRAMQSLIDQNADYRASIRATTNAERDESVRRLQIQRTQLQEQVRLAEQTLETLERTGGTPESAAVRFFLGFSAVPIDATFDTRETRKQQGILDDLRESLELTDVAIQNLQALDPDSTFGGLGDNAADAAVSIQELRDRLSTLNEEFERSTDPAARARIGEQIQQTQAQIESIEAARRRQREAAGERRAQIEQEKAAEGSLAQLREQLAEQRKRFEMAVTEEARAQANERIQIVQAEIDAIEELYKSEDPLAPAKAWVDRLETEFKRGFKSAEEVLGLLVPRAQELQQELEAAFEQFGFSSPEFQEALGKLEIIEGVLDRLFSRPIARPEATAKVSEQFLLLARVQEELEQATRRARIEAELSGDFSQVQVRRADDLRRAIIALRLGGFEPTSEAVVELVEEYEALRRSQDALGRSTEQFEGFIKGLVESFGGVTDAIQRYQDLQQQVNAITGQGLTPIQSLRQELEAFAQANPLAALGISNLLAQLDRFEQSEADAIFASLNREIAGLTQEPLNRYQLLAERVREAGEASQISAEQVRELLARLESAEAAEQAQARLNTQLARLGETVQGALTSTRQYLDLQQQVLEITGQAPTNLERLRSSLESFASQSVIARAVIAPLLAQLDAFAERSRFEVEADFAQRIQALLDAPTRFANLAVAIRQAGDEGRITEAQVTSLLATLGEVEAAANAEAGLRAFETTLRNLLNQAERAELREVAVDLRALATEAGFAFDPLDVLERQIDALEESGQRSREEIDALRSALALLRNEAAQQQQADALAKQLDGIAAGIRIGTEILQGLDQVLTAQNAAQAITGLTRIGVQIGTLIGGPAAGQLIGAIGSALGTVVGILERLFDRSGPARRALQQGLRAGVNDGLRQGFRAFLASESDWREQLYEGVRDAVENALIDALITGAVLQGALGRLINQIADAAARGNWERVNQLIGQIPGALNEILPGLENAFGQLRSSLDSALPRRREAGSDLPDELPDGRFFELPNATTNIVTTPQWVGRLELASTRLLEGATMIRDTFGDLSDKGIAVKNELSVNGKNMGSTFRLAKV